MINYAQTLILLEVIASTQLTALCNNLNPWMYAECKITG